MPHDDAPLGAFADVLRMDVDGQTVEYYPAGREVPVLLTADLRGYEYRIDVASDHHPRLRRAAVWLRVPGDVVRVFGALHWADRTDLDALDGVVADAAIDTGTIDARTIDGTPFDAALFTVASDVTCLTCHSSSLVAAIDPGLPLSSVTRAAGHRMLVHCPVCGADRYRPHLEVLQT